MEEKNPARAYYFLFSFFVAFLAFSLVIFAAVSIWSKQKTEEPTVKQTAVQEEKYMPGAEESLNVLFMGMRAGGEAPEIYVLARFDAVGGRVPLTVLPANMATKNKNKTEPLFEVYKYGGAMYTAEVLESALGVKIDRYVRLDTKSFIAVADTVGSIELELDEEAQANGITLAEGLQLLDGRKAAALLRSKNKEGIAAEICAAIINQRKDIMLSTAADEVFARIINIIDTNITYVDYNNRKEAAKLMAEKAEAAAVVIKAYGEVDEENNMYKLSDVFLAQLASEML